MKARVHIMLKSAVLDPQGKAIEHALVGLGFDAVEEVRQGKVIDIRLADGLSPETAEAQVRAMCDKLLANPVIESYQIAIEA